MELEQRLKIFVYDLLNFESSEEAKNRLGFVVGFDKDALFGMTKAYMSAEEFKQLMGSGSGQRIELLKEAFETMLKRKKAKANFKICSSHDLAPIFQEVFDIRKDFHKHSAFKDSGAK